MSVFLRQSTRRICGSAWLINYLLLLIENKTKPELARSNKTEGRDVYIACDKVKNLMHT